MKKQNKNDEMDEWLESRDCYRKQIARDGSCLFRAVAEQVFNTQSLYLEVRYACIRFMERNQEKFESFVEGPFEQHLCTMQNPTEWAGQVEMTALSLMYKRDFMIYQEVGKLAHDATVNGFDDKVWLCYSHYNHYDSVYSNSFHNNAAVSQSLVYELLYKQVFRMGDEVDLAVEKMLHDKTYAKMRKDSTASLDSTWDKMDSPPPDFSLHSLSDPDSSPEKEKWQQLEDESGCIDIKKAINQGIPPFPYKVAKALDANMYRNVELDIWNEARKEESQFQPGTKCLVYIDRSKAESYHAHIQEITSDKGPVTVYIEELGEKKTVPYENLQALPTSPSKDKFKSRKKMGKRKFNKDVTVYPVFVGHGQPVNSHLQNSPSQFDYQLMSCNRRTASNPIPIDRPNTRGQQPRPRCAISQNNNELRPHFQPRGPNSNRFIAPPARHNFHNGVHNNNGQRPVRPDRFQFQPQQNQPRLQQQVNGNRQVLVTSQGGATGGVPLPWTGVPLQFNAPPPPVVGNGDIVHAPGTQPPANSPADGVSFGRRNQDSDINQGMADMCIPPSTNPQPQQSFQYNHTGVPHAGPHIPQHGVAVDPATGTHHFVDINPQPSLHPQGLDLPTDYSTNQFYYNLGVYCSRSCHRHFHGVDLQSGYPVVSFTPEGTPIAQLVYADPMNDGTAAVNGVMRYSVPRHPFQMVPYVHGGTVYYYPTALPVPTNMDNQQNNP